MRLPELDDRLRAAMELVPPCLLCADIGADHGRLSAALLQSGRCGRMVVSDVSAKALQKARALLSRTGLDGRCTFRVADGLDALQEKCDCVCVLGMGGRTIAEILRCGAERLQGARLVLGAQTDLPQVRQAVQAIGYHLADEQAVRDGGRLYLLLVAMPGAEAPYSPKELWLGPRLMRRRDEATRAYYAHQQAYLAEAISGMQCAKAAQDVEKQARLQEYRTLLTYIEQVLSCFEEGEP